MRRGARPGLEGVGRGGASERQLHVGVGVDTARDDELSGGVDGLVGLDPVAASQQCSDLAVLDEDVGLHLLDGSHDGATLDQSLRHCPLLGLDQRAVGVGPTVSIESPDLAHLVDLVHVEVAHDDLLVGVGGRVSDHLPAWVDEV